MAQGVKTIDEQKFCEAYMKFLAGEMSIRKAAKYIGISDATVMKYFNIALSGGQFPDTLFKDRRTLAKERREKHKNE
jgi:transposase